MKSLLQLIFSTIILLGVTLPLQAQKTPDAARTVAWETFKQTQGENWAIRWNDRTGLPRTVTGSKTTPYAGNPEAAARAFLQEQATLFGMKPRLDDLGLQKVQQQGNLRHVSFTQTYKGLPVEGGQYKVHLTEDGRVIMANGHYYPGIDVPTTPSLSEETAFTRALGHLEAERKGAEMNSSLVIFPEGSEYRLAYKMDIQTRQPVAHWWYFVDAQNGEILQRVNQIFTFIDHEIAKEIESVIEAPVETGNAISTAMVTGTGDVYPDHPGISSITTKSLLGLDGNGKLDGAFVRAMNGVSSEAFSSSHVFQYPTTNTHFDEVNLYFHVDDYRRNFVEGLDDGNDLFPFIEAYAHDDNSLECTSSACFDSDTEDIYFPDNLDWAKDDIVIYHEYSHKIVWDIESGITFFDNEEGAISEGVPDYWAGSFTGRSKIGDWALAPPLYFNSIRDMANPDIGTYAEYISERDSVSPVGFVPGHDGGEFFSSVLWDLRNDPLISPSTADQLVFDALFILSGTPDFMEFRDAMMAVERANGGDYEALIQDTFAAKGLGQPAVLSIGISGLTHFNSGDNGTWRAHPKTGYPPYDITWFRAYDPFFGPWTQVGTGDQYSQSVTQDMYLKATVTDDKGSFAQSIFQVSLLDGGGGPGGGPDPEANPVTAGPVEPDIPETFILQQNFPNPFNPTTQISYGLPEAAQVSITVYDITGRQVAVLANGSQSAGRHTVSFQAENLSSGMYIARIEAVGNSGQVFTRNIKMQLIK